MIEEAPTKYEKKEMPSIDGAIDEVSEKSEDDKSWNQAPHRDYDSYDAPRVDMSNYYNKNEIDKIVNEAMAKTYKAFK